MQRASLFSEGRPCNNRFCEAELFPKGKRKKLYNALYKKKKVKSVLHFIILFISFTEIHHKF